MGGGGALGYKPFEPLGILVKMIFCASEWSWKRAFSGDCIGQNEPFLAIVLVERAFLVLHWSKEPFRSDFIGQNEPFPVTKFIETRLFR